MKANKTLAAVLAVTLLSAATVSMQASAASSVGLAASKDEVKAGETFSIDVSLSDIPSTKINCLDFAVTFDSSALDVTSVTAGAALNTGADSADSTASSVPLFAYNIVSDAVNISWTTGASSDYWIANGGVVFTITGTVKAGTADGSYPIDFAPISRETYEGSGVMNSKMIIGYASSSASEVYTLNTTAGAVVVTSEAVTTTTTQVTTTTTQATTTTTTKATTTTAKPDETTTAAAGPTTATLLGDVNLDNKVDLADVVVLSKIAAGSVSATDVQNANGDLNVDKSVNSKDGSILSRFLTGAISSLPVTD